MNRRLIVRVLPITDAVDQVDQALGYRNAQPETSGNAKSWSFIRQQQKKFWPLRWAIRAYRAAVAAVTFILYHHNIAYLTFFFF